MKIQRDSATPLYQQLASALRQQIESGRWKPGAALPPETELTRQFRVSRVTARLAVDLLVSEHLVVRKQGKGTYVCPPQVQQDLNSLQGFAELMAARGPEQQMQVLSFETVSPSPAVAAALRLGEGDKALRIKRRHLLRGAPIAYAVIYLPRTLARSFSLRQVSRTPIYTLLTERAHVEIKRAVQVVRALGADQEAVHLLGLARGAPVMTIERITYSSAEEPVEYILFFYRGDSYELSVELHRDPSKSLLYPAQHLGPFAPDS